MSLKMMFLRNYFLIDKNSFFPHLDLHFWFLDTRIDNERPWILKKIEGGTCSYAWTKKWMPKAPGLFTLSGSKMQVIPKS